MIIDVPNGEFDTELTLIGPTTLTWTANTGTAFTEPFPTTYPLTLTLKSGEVDFLEDISFNMYTISGPTTFTTNAVNSGDVMFFVNSIETETDSFSTFVPEGTQALQVPVGTGYSDVTIVGPTTFDVTFTQIAYFATDDNVGVIAGGDTTAASCSLQPSTFANDPNRIVTYAYQYLSLSAGQTTVTLSPKPLTTAIENGFTDTFIPFVTATFIGPTVFSVTTTQDLFNGLTPGDQVPGLRCAGLCGYCAVLFPTVSVLYWPVASPNTACLSTVTSTQAPSNSSGPGVVVKARSLSGLSGSGSTLVNPQGFTFTSPSVYIVFPTISAIDSCGILGSIHTSTTLAFAPGDVSTAALSSGINVYNSFNFADVSCPPADATVPLYSIIGQTGYVDIRVGAGWPF